MTTQEILTNNTLLKNYTENVATALRGMGFGTSISWQPQASSGPFTLPLTGSLRITKTDPKVGAITIGQGMTYDVMHLYSVDQLAKKMSTLWTVKAINAGSTTQTTYVRPTATTAPKTSSGAVSTTVTENSVDSNKTVGTTVGSTGVSDAGANLVTGTIEAQIKALAGKPTLNWDQWNYYAQQVTKTPGAAPEAYKLTRQADGQVVINGTNQLTFDVWWSYVHGHYGQGASTGGAGTGGGTSEEEKISLISQIVDIVMSILLTGAKK